MIKRNTIEFIESQQPITGLVTKFGGQPVWSSEPQWPLSQSTGNPMQFICQIVIGPELFHTSAKMAYFFMSEEDSAETWAPDSGENAIILQPALPHIKTKPLKEGPSLFCNVKKSFFKRSTRQPCEFAVALVPGEDPEFADEMEIRKNWEDDQADAYFEAIAGNKIGGTPSFVQSTEFPGPGKWQLLLQLDSTRVPFWINFGDAGVGYAFLSDDGQIAKFLWQCC